MNRDFRKIAVSALAVFGSFGVSAHAQSAELKQAVDLAFTYTDVQRFDEALLILDAVSETDKQHMLYSLTRARILTWSRNYMAAEVEYSNLLALYPDNPDVNVSYAYLQLFDGKLLNAEHYFSKVLRIYPDYEDAVNGLQRTRNLRNERRSIFNTVIN